MAHKDVRSDLSSCVGWRVPLSAASVVAPVVCICLLLNCLIGAQTARAQTAANSAQGKSGAPADGTAETKVMAVVNGQQITRDRLASECLRRYGEEVLGNVVNRHLILQACQKQGIKITSEDINQEITRLAGKLGLSPDRLLQVLRDERDITPQQYQRDIVWPMLALRRLAAGQMAVTPQELQEAFQSEYGPRVQVRMISASTRAKADQVRALAVANPSEFPNLAKEHSADVNSAAARGLIPPIRKHMGAPEVEKAAFALKAGGISPVIEAAGQYLIFKCERHIPATPILEQQRKAIQEQLTERIGERKLRTEATEMFQRLQQDATVVNVYNDAKLRKTMPGVAATINGGRITTSQLADQCLVRHGKDTLEDEINREILRQALKRRGQDVTQEAIQREVDRAAETYGYVNEDGTPNREAWLKHITTEQEVTVDVYVRDVVWPTVALKTLVTDEIEVTEDDINKGFIANYGERVQVLAIVVGNRHTANEVWKMAKDNPDERFFGELAHEYSIEPVSRANFGQVPPIGRHGGQPLVEAEAFSLNANNKLSGVLSVADKFIVLWYLGRTEPVVKEVAAVRDELVKDIHEKKQRVAMARRFEQLKDRAQIDNLLTGTTQSGKSAEAAPASHQVPAPARTAKGSGPRPASQSPIGPTRRSASRPTQTRRGR